MSGNGEGYTFNTSVNGENGENGTNQEENHMPREYFVRQHAGIFDNSSSFISPAKKEELKKIRLTYALQENKKEMERMLKNVEEKKVLLFDSEKYKRLVQMNIDLRNQLHEEPKKEYFYPPSFFKRLTQRCTGEECKLVEVPYTPKPPSYYRKRKQTKVNTRKSNTRKSNTRKRSNF